MRINRMVMCVSLLVVLLSELACTEVKEVKETCTLSKGKLSISSWHGNNFGVAAELHGWYRVENSHLTVEADTLDLRQVINGYYGYVTVKQLRIVVLGDHDDQHFTTYAKSEPLPIGKTFDQDRALTLGSQQFTLNLGTDVPLGELWLGIEIENAEGGYYYAHTPRNFFARELARTGCIDSPCEHIDTIAAAIEARCDSALTQELERWNYPLMAWLDTLYDRPAPVWVALAEKNIEAMRILHAHDIDIDVAGKGGETPLMLAAANGSAEMVSTLLVLGADPNYAIPNGEQAGRTALNGAIAAHSIDTVAQLLKHGGRADLPDAYGWLPVHYAVYYDSIPSLEVLEQAGNDLDLPAPGQRGETPLMVAAQYAKIDAIKFLLEHGASLHRTDRYGKNALDYARYFNKPEAADLLMSAADD